MSPKVLGLIGMGVLFLVLFFPRLFPGKPKERTCPYCKTKINYKAKVCPACRRESEAGFLDTGREMLHSFSWFFVIVLILVALVLAGIVEI